MKYPQSTLIALAFVFLVCSCGGGGGGGGGAPIANPNPDAENAIALETTVGSPAEPSGGAPVIDDAIEGMVKFPLATVTGSASYKYIHPGTLHQYDAAGSFIEGRTVTLESFYISDHEVTQKEFFEVRGYNPARFKDSPDGSEVQEERPVENVNWYEALEYCNEKSRLEGLEPCYVIRGTTDIEKWKPLPPEAQLLYVTGMQTATASRPFLSGNMPRAAEAR